MRLAASFQFTTHAVNHAAFCCTPKHTLPPWDLIIPGVVMPSLPCKKAFSKPRNACSCPCHPGPPPTPATPTATPAPVTGMPASETILPKCLKFTSFAVFLVRDFVGGDGEIDFVCVRRRQCVAPRNGNDISATNIVQKWSRTHEARQPMAASGCCDTRAGTKLVSKQSLSCNKYAREQNAKPPSTYLLK